MQYRAVQCRVQYSVITIQYRTPTAVQRWLSSYPTALRKEFTHVASFPLLCSLTQPRSQVQRVTPSLFTHTTAAVAASVAVATLRRTIHH